MRWPARVVSFGEFRFDPSEHRLWRGVDEVVLRPKATALLAHLLRHSGELVTKQQLLDAVWPDTSVSDAVLKVCVSEIRRALRDGHDGARFIETRHGRGYRLTAPVVASAEAPKVAETQPAPLIARDAEIAVLGDSLDRAIAGERQVVFVTGEPGLGKTALVDAFVARVVDRHQVWVASGVAVRYQGPAEPFVPVLEALRHLHRQIGHDAMAGLLRAHAPTWLPHLPWAAEPSSPPTGSVIAAEASRARMLREMTEALAVLTAERPLLLVLEDLHWADLSTLDLVAFLARPREPARLLIVGTSQPLVSLPGAHPLKAITRELTIHRRCVELPLAPFGPAAVASYLQARLQNGWWPTGLVEWIHQWTEGNPLYVTSLIDELLRRGVLVPRGGAWTMAGAIEDVEVQVPDLVRELTAMTLDGLDEFDRRILEAASVAGREFSAAEVAAALTEDVQAIEERCEQLVRRQQCLDLAGTSHFRFIHAFAQQVLSQQIPSRLRVRLRQRVRQHSARTAESPLRVARRARAVEGPKERRLARKRR